MHACLLMWRTKLVRSSRVPCMSGGVWQRAQQLSDSRMSCRPTLVVGRHRRHTV